MKQIFQKEKNYSIRKRAGITDDENEFAKKMWETLKIDQKKFDETKQNLLNTCEKIRIL